MPLVVKGPIGGERRPHFAHPSGHGPAGGQHEPESEWHLASKEAVATWARTQPDVIDVRSEVWLPNRKRRCDVRVVFADGSEVALEVQSYRLTDADWGDRHRDYRRAGVADVWLWHPDSPVPWMILSGTEHPQQIWMLDPWKGSVTLMVGAPHQRQPATTAGEIHHRVQHLPPCTGDDLVPYVFPLSDITLTPDGIAIPAELTKRLAERLEKERRRLEAAEDARKRIRQQLSAPAGPSKAPTASSSEVGAIEAAWPVIREKARELGGAAVDALLAGASVVRLDGTTVIFAHQHAVLARYLTTPKYAEPVRAAVQQVLGRDYGIRWEGGAPLDAPTKKHAAGQPSPQSKQRFEIQASHVEDFDQVFDLLRLAGATYAGGDREFVIERSTFTFEQVWALIELVRHPERPKVESPWQPNAQA
ncbi:competence protein CoiA family protein [Nocardia amamiensis]|uniref:competence protein CoiA family protein n=1 Tax=Nocardia amamiensis TaxID=404578 RepID=UPI003404AF9D